MSGHELRGEPAAPGIAVGVVRRLAAVGPSGELVAPERRAGERDRALAALERAARDLEALAERLGAEGLGPADVAELGDGVRGLALAGGGATAHAAIVARGLGIPLVAGLGSGASGLESGELLIVDGTAGVVVVSPSRERADAARAAV